MHCGIGREKDKRKSQRKNDYVVNLTNQLSLLRAPADQNAFVFIFLYGIWAIYRFHINQVHFKSREFQGRVVT